MTATSGPERLGRDVSSVPSVERFLETKLHRPPERDTWVRRPRLLDVLDQAERHPVTLVAAPAGYGKTTLVAQWLHTHDRHKAAWVSLDPGDNDPHRLWTHVATALERAGCVLPSYELPSLSGGPGQGPLSVLPAIVRALQTSPDDVFLVLDDFHVIQSPDRHEEVELLLSSLPARAHLVIATRSDPGLRLGRLRVSRALVELRAEDLAFTTAEARELLAAEGVALSGGTLSLLLERTEGWPAALYLAALSMAGRADPDDFVERFSGGNRFVGDYLAEEVLSRHTDRVREFILDVSILGRFSSSLCDYVTGVTDSASILHDLQRANLFLVSLDSKGEWFRFHHLFSAMAGSELELAHPDRVRLLHSRAAEWFALHGYVEEAVEHFLLAGRTEDAALLVQRHWLQFADGGRPTTVLKWLEALEVAEWDSATTATAAWMTGTVGNEAAFHEHLSALDGSSDEGPLPDGSRSIESAVALMRGLFGYGGPLDMHESAQRAVQLETDISSPFYGIGQFALGHSLYVLGELDQAIAPVRAAAGGDRAPGVIRVLALSVEAFVEHERGEFDAAAAAAEMAMDVVVARGLLASPPASLAFAAIAQAQAAAGNGEDAMNTLHQGLTLRRQGNAQAIWASIHQLLVSAGVAAPLGHTSLADDLLAEVTMRTNRFAAGMTAMESRVSAVRRLVSDNLSAGLLMNPLTERELSVLRMLQGSLSLQEIARELYLSPNTVKTHASAVYRKLGAHSRAQAVAVARARSLV